MVTASLSRLALNFFKINIYIFRLVSAIVETHLEHLMELKIKINKLKKAGKYYSQGLKNSTLGKNTKCKMYIYI